MSDYSTVFSEEREIRENIFDLEDGSAENQTSAVII
jgi:hypothetical protein